MRFAAAVIFGVMLAQVGHAATVAPLHASPLREKLRLEDRHGTPAERIDRATARWQDYFANARTVRELISLEKALKRYCAGIVRAARTELKQAKRILERETEKQRRERLKHRPARRA